MEKIAVVGMSCLLPGAENYKEYWQNLLDGKDLKKEACFEQMGVDPDAYFSPEKGTPDKFYCMEGGYVSGFEFDPTGYDLSPGYLEKLDDLYKWSLFVAKEALKDSGYRYEKSVPDSCGVILGNLSFPTRTSNKLFLPMYHNAVEESLRKLPGNGNFKLSPFSENLDVNCDNQMISGYPAALISKALSLKGMNFAIDAACSSSIYSVKIACDYLVDRKADMMLAGAVSCADPFFINMGFSIFQAYPSSSQSSPLDKHSGGLIAGEGAGMFVLKRLDDAIKDGDKIYAAISGVGVSNDGRGQSVLSPSALGQHLSFERAYEKAGVNPKHISFVECHATGTPLGDKVEMDSMDTFFGKYGAFPYAGSSKSNLGHLLTAAGMGGMIKTIMALNEKVIPGTINVTDAQHSANQVIPDHHIPVSTVPFPDNDVDGVRYAAVSGFGFGGTNGHIIFEKKDEFSIDNEPLEKKSSREAENALPLSIVGMDAVFGPACGLDDLFNTIYENLQHFGDLPKNRWMGIDKYGSLLKQYGMKEGKAPKGAYIDAFDIDFLEFRIPPNKDDRLIPQQLLALKVADNAIKDAGLKEGTNTAVLVAMGTELSLHRFRGRVNLETQIEDSLLQNGMDLPEEAKALFKDSLKKSIHGVAKVNQYTSFIGNIMAARISSVWNFSGPSHSLSSEENSVSKAIEIARLLIASKDVDTVVVSAVDLSGGFENVLIRNQHHPVNSGVNTLSFDRHADGWMVGEGAGAIVLKARDRAVKDNDRIYASIEALGFSNGITEDHVENVSKKTLDQANIKDTDIGYLELCASGFSGYDDAEIKGLAPVYGKNGAMRCAVGSIKSNIGHTFAASGMAAVIKTALCLYKRVIPGTPFFTVPKHPEYWENSRLFVPKDPLTWILGKETPKRYAAINILGADITTSHMILSDEPRKENASLEIRARKKASRSLIKSVKTGGKDIELSILSPENIALFNDLNKHRTLQTPANKQQTVNCSRKKENKNMPVPELSELPPCESKTSYITDTKELSFSYASGDTEAFLKREEEKHQNNMALLAEAHLSFLKARTTGIKEIGELIRMQTEMLSGEETSVLLSDPPPVENFVIPSRQEDAEIIAPHREKVASYRAPGNEKQCIWDQNELLEFAEGNISNVFGDAYAIIDTYKRRVRLPMEEYLLVTRVTELEAERGVYKPSKMTTEYDIPFNSPFIIDGQIPWAVAVESGQCDLLLISYLGIDFDCKGDRVYRLLDCTLTFVEDIAMAGDTLRYEISINSFAKSGGSLLFFFSYRCFVKDLLVLKMDGGCAGFFTDEELDAGKGIIHMEEELSERKKVEKTFFKPLLTCPKKSFKREEILNIVHGDRGACFGEPYAQNGLNPSLKFSSEKMLMIDGVSNIDVTGGPWGLGLVEAEKILMPEHWYFPCHFKDDQVMAGSLMAEGCGQLLQFFMLYIGLHTKTVDARFQPIKNLPQKVRCRGQVTPQKGILKYRLEVKEIGTDPTPYAIADIDIILDDKIVVDFKNLGVHLVEKNDDDAYKMDAGLLGGLTKNMDVPEKEGADFKDENALFTQYHLQHFAKGTISECFGPDFKIYDNRTAPRTPNGDLQLTTRVTEVHGTRLDFSQPAYCVAEYEVPHDAWYFKNNSHPGVMPYSIIMEIALQPCGFISAYMGTTLKSPDTDFFFRNLDGQGTILMDIDLRGKTIVNKSTLITTAAMGNTIIQTFEFSMWVDGKDYYKGTAAFGYFVAAALEDQVGLDNGIDNHPMTEEKYLKGQEITFIDLKSDDARKMFYKVNKERPYYRLTDPQLDFLSEVQIVKEGGEKGLGYVYADRPINRSDWFFECHFFEDPVMPGSLGVESVMQALQVFAIACDLGKQFQSPRFSHVLDKIIWKYRGQINPEIDKMAIEVHITAVEKTEDKVTVKGDASLWKDKIRIYEVKDIALILEES